MRLFITLFFYLFMSSAVKSQQLSDSIKTALLIIDIQEFYFPNEGNQGLVNAEEASHTAGEVLRLFREEHQLVVHVKHRSEYRGDIRPIVAPIDSEKVITKEKINSFEGTDLLAYLKENKITRLILIGMQTHLCLEAATRAASDFGFECIVIEDACATKDLTYGDKIIKAEDVHASTLATLQTYYGKVINLQEFNSNKVKYLFKKIE